MNARSKGKRVERLWRDQLNAAGFSGSYRNAQQSNGGVNGAGYNPDVACPALPRLHSEVKGVEKLNVRQAMQQSIDDAGDKHVPIVAWKKNNQPWLVVMKADDWFKLVHSGSAYLTSSTLTVSGSMDNISTTN